LVGVFKKWAALNIGGDIRDTYEVQELDKFTVNLRINFALYVYNILHAQQQQEQQQLLAFRGRLFKAGIAITLG
jgi:hypothetical protein